ncbi:hypothetical protein [Halobacillus seohaensis]|uniref:Uncharacterized protein n=1 Tax=Halobacillus seohaensis TaxID=447421 RepID=A0ABW2ES57_9BACI
MRSESIEVNVNYHIKGDEGKPQIISGKGRVIGDGLVLAADNDGFDVFQYNSRTGDTVEVFSDNHALISIGYNFGNESVQSRITDLIREGTDVVSWIRAAIQLNEQAHDNSEGGTV